jgi:hypothetical protein
MADTGELLRALTDPSLRIPGKGTHEPDTAPLKDGEGESVTLVHTLTTVA